MRGRFALALVLVTLTARAHAEEVPAGAIEVRHDVHWGLGAGGFSALTGPAEYGLSLGGEVYPGGQFGRYGLRAELRGWEDGEDGLAAMGVTFIAAASRPRLQLALYGELGLTYDQQRPTVGGGVQTQLWIKWPVAVALGADALLIVDGTDTALALSGSLQLRIAY